MFKEKRKTIKHYLNNKLTDINLLNIYKSNLTGLPKRKKKIFKDFLNNDSTGNNLLNINNLNLINSLKKTSFLKGKDKTVKNLLINKLSKTLSAKRKLSIIKVSFIKRNL